MVRYRQRYGDSKTSALLIPDPGVWLDQRDNGYQLERIFVYRRYQRSCPSHCTYKSESHLLMRKNVSLLE
jgi:hypothetical protein